MNPENSSAPSETFQREGLLPCEKSAMRLCTALRSWNPPRIPRYMISSSKKKPRASLSVLPKSQDLINSCASITQEWWKFIADFSNPLFISPISREKFSLFRLLLLCFTICRKNIWFFLKKGLTNSNRFVGQIINPSYSLYHNQSQISIWKAKPPNLFWQGGLNVLQLHTHSNGFIYSALSHFCDDNSVVVFDYPLVYPKGNGERLAVYLTHSLITTSFVAALYRCGAAIFDVWFWGYFSASINKAILNSHIVSTIRQWVRGLNPWNPFRLTPRSAT